MKIGIIKKAMKVEASSSTVLEGKLEAIFDNERSTADIAAPMLAFCKEAPLNLLRREEVSVVGKIALEHALMDQDEESLKELGWNEKQIDKIRKLGYI